MASEGIAIDPYCEAFHYFKIRALAEKGDTALALSLYEGVERLFDARFHIKPSAKLRKLRESLTLSERAENAEEALSAVQKRYKPGDALSSDAFAALLSFVKNATTSCHLFALLTVDNPEDLEAAEQLLNRSLTEGEYFCRFSKQQFALLLLTDNAGVLKDMLNREKIAATVELRLI